MRDRGRERNSEFSGYGGKRDFRDGLASIFIDNLNPKVNVEGLWGIFRSFGHLRDIFLLSKNKTRRSCYAFVRFDTVEEANKVAGMVDGMHVYEAVKVKPTARQDIERVLSFEWNGQKFKKEWLSRCAVGILKEFSSVNSRLSSRGFMFSSSYLGDKLILWCFESAYEMEGFIMNRFFWDDIFLSVSIWSNAFVPQVRLAWINVKGIPASYWCHFFLVKFGGLFGEPLMVDKESCLRRRVDRVRFLAIIQTFRTVPRVVNMVIRKEVFLAAVMEETEPVPYSWLSNLLGLTESSNLNSPLVGERFGVNHREKSCSVQIVATDCRDGLVVGEKPIWQRKRTDLGDNKGDEVQGYHRNEGSLYPFLDWYWVT
ncbi:hypothetical protein Dsin_016989 [Dipteronia sinensis]|uniref:RRM domain-containing protein n=1 Tax=Dipteronia sinensis TaxID=43782 RepID=A0AAE0AEZ0_9ROSI|nr:hypothetical protein Dsin_016989 [Dipteronia sinensis]